MRSAEEMLKLIMDKAENDERIRAVTMEGSRSNENATHDKYSDFDICYFVNDIREFTKDKIGFGISETFLLYSAHATGIRSHMIIMVVKDSHILFNLRMEIELI